MYLVMAFQRINTHMNNRTHDHVVKQRSRKETEMKIRDRQCLKLFSNFSEHLIHVLIQHLRCVYDSSGFQTA